MHTTFFASSLTALLSLGTLASAHMEMQFPPPLRSKFNKLATSVDSDMTSPLKADGSNYPCKGYQSLLDSADGGSVTTFTPGQKYQYTIVGGANHEGGSCQASLSYDQGKTFTTIGSVVGDCPGQTSSNFSFTVPSDAPAGDKVLFAWSWFNKVGNREMYMNCASVTIGGAASKRNEELVERDGSTAYSSRPAIFVANVGTAGNGCTTTESVDVMFPNPGPDLVQAADAKPGPPVCPNGSSGGSSGSTASGSTAPTTAAAGGSGGAASSAATSKVTSAAAGGASSSASAPGGVFVTASSAEGGSGGASTTAQESTAQPTTLQTATKASSASAPTGTGTGSGSSGSGSSGSGSSGSGSSGGSAGTACTDEGAWDCIDGSSFSRCASGEWSAAMPMASGTSCQPGISDNLIMTRKLKRDGPRRSFSAWNGVPVVVRDGQVFQG